MTELEHATQPSRHPSSRPPCAFDADEVPTTPWRVGLGAPSVSVKARATATAKGKTTKAAPAKRRPPPLPTRALRSIAAREEAAPAPAAVPDAKLPSTFPKHVPTLQTLHTPKPARTVAPEDLPLVMVAAEAEDREAPLAEPPVAAASAPVIELSDPFARAREDAADADDAADDTVSLSVRPSARAPSWKLRIVVVAIAFAGELLLGGPRGALRATAVRLHVATADVASAPAVLAAPAAPLAPVAPVAPAPSSAKTEPPSPAAAASSTTTADVPPDQGVLDTSAAPSGRRVFVDERTVGQTPFSPLVACGRHKVQIGSAGHAHVIDVPCGGTAHLATP